MSDNNELIKVFTGSEIAVNLLKSKLEDIGVHGIIKNGFQSGIIAGFGGGTSSSVDFFIQVKDQEKADEILHEFLDK